MVYHSLLLWWRDVIESSVSSSCHFLSLWIDVIFSRIKDCNSDDSISFIWKKSSSPSIACPSSLLENFFRRKRARIKELSAFWEIQFPFWLLMPVIRRGRSLRCPCRRHRRRRRLGLWSSCSKVLVEGRLRAIAQWLERPAVLLPSGVILSSSSPSSESSESSCHPRNSDLRHRHWNRLLRYLVDQRWELVKMCWKDGCCFGLFDLQGLRLRPSPWRTGLDVFSDWDLVKAIKSLPSTWQVSSGEATWNIYPNSIFIVHDSSDVAHWRMYKQLFFLTEFPFLFRLCSWKGLRIT